MNEKTYSKPREHRCVGISSSVDATVRERARRADGESFYLTSRRSPSASRAIMNSSISSPLRVHGYASPHLSIIEEMSAVKDLITAFTKMPGIARAGTNTRRVKRRFYDGVDIYLYTLGGQGAAWDTDDGRDRAGREGTEIVSVLEKGRC